MALPLGPLPMLMYCKEAVKIGCRGFLSQILWLCKPLACLNMRQYLRMRQLCLLRAAALQVACKPGTIKPHSRFEGEIYALNKEEGGRHTPFFTNYKPQFFFRTADITGKKVLSIGHTCLEKVLGV